MFVNQVLHMNVLALDIGGANLKLADGCGFAVARPFPLWQQPGRLGDALVAVLAAAPAAEVLAVTMTGELADCYATKRAGVGAILDAVGQAAGSRRTLVYLTDGSFASPETARQRFLEAAASNWHALASFAARFLEGAPGLMFDIGSTTCDIVPVLDGRPATRAKTDPARLMTGELVYAGVRRTPICAVVDRLPWRGNYCPVAAELFAATGDVYLLLEELAEDPGRCDTADGRAQTKDAAWDRMARSICADREMFDAESAIEAATFVAKALERRVADGARKVVFAMPEPPRAVLVSGEGEFLARRVLSRLRLNAQVISLGEQFGAAASQTAPAHALAVLARAYLAKG
ncbi:MAG: tetrahydromethanopterin-linked C1 transfer pathway [Pirellulales bacterium]|nr:tetrahydromethanopterin-linked C1 transfer pathway [Pirellulales bacterium]